MGADFGAFLQDADADLAILFGGQLARADGRRQTGGACADDDEVVFHYVTFGHVSSGVD